MKVFSLTVKATGLLFEYNIQTSDLESSNGSVLTSGASKVRRNHQVACERQIRIKSCKFSVALQLYAHLVCALLQSEEPFTRY